ncbi:MAG: cytochrome c [Gammaproteobacteria bacterium]|nr:cytochrome c [Gammaproteobacteria bacterium]
MKIFIVALISVLLSSCFDSDAQAASKIQLGKTTFENNCVVCHGKAGQGIVKDWKKRQADGSFPAPPLNGSAHTWHHSPKLLLNTINNGGTPLGGWMPAFKDKLTDKEKQAVLDYLHSLWPKNIQQKYNARFK